MVVNVVLTERIKTAISDVKRVDKTPKELLERLSEYDRKQSVQNEDEKVGIEFALVKEAWEVLKKNNSSSGPVYLHEVLEGSDVCVPPLKPPKRNPELVARLEKLKAQQDRLKYNAMVSNLGSVSLSKYDASNELAVDVRTTSKQLSSIFSFLVSIGAAFLFGFVAAQYAFPNVAIRVVIGIVIACLVAIADIYFMARTEI